MKVDILGIKIDDVSLDQVVSKVEQWLTKPGPASPAKRGEKHYIVTPNPEILVMAQDDKDLKEAINNADLAIPDGVGLKLAGDIVMTTPGVDVMEGLVKMAEEKGFTTGFLGGRGEVAVKSAERLRKKYSKLKVTFAGSGGEIDQEGSQLSVLSGQLSDESLSVVSQSNKQKTDKPNSENRKPIPDNWKADILFVAFGPPKQEKWIVKNLSKIPVKVAMGVGGAFDLISGQVPRAPIWIRHLGFEWLFRLCLQPWRIKRQLALIRYLYLLLRG